MARLSFRLDDDLYDQVMDRAHASGLTPSAYLRAIVERFEGQDPAGYHERFDELHATAIQMLAILAAHVAAASPQALAEGMEQARALLIDRGLLGPTDASVDGAPQ